MQFPRIHINGTSGEDLLAQYEKASRAVEAAVEAVAAGGPHGRDYYVIEYPAGDPCQQAIEEHHARLSKLRQVAVEINAIWQDLYFQQEERKARW